MNTPNQFLEDKSLYFTLVSVSWFLVFLAIALLIAFKYYQLSLLSLLLTVAANILTRSTSRLKDRLSDVEDINLTVLLSNYFRTTAGLLTPQQSRNTPKNRIPRDLIVTQHVAQLRKSVHLAVVGDTGSGKSTWLNYLANHVFIDGSQVFLDPHCLPDARGLLVPQSASEALKALLQLKAGDVITVGYERNYQAISHMVEALKVIQDKRYTKGYNNFRAESFINVFADEVLAIKMNDVDQSWVSNLPSFLSEARKVKIRFIMGVHNPNVEGLGLKGASPLKQCMSWLIIGKIAFGDRSPNPKEVKAKCREDYLNSNYCSSLDGCWLPVIDISPWGKDEELPEELADPDLNSLGTLSLKVNSQLPDGFLDNFEETYQRMRSEGKNHSTAVKAVISSNRYYKECSDWLKNNEPTS